MKKHLFTGLVTLGISSAAFSAPLLMGDTRIQDELVIMHGKIVCSASSYPVGNFSAQTVVFGEIKHAFATADNNIQLSGSIDGDNFYINGNPFKSLNIELSSKAKDGENPQYRAESSGVVTDLVVRGEKVQGVHLNVTLNGKVKLIGCSIH